MSSATESGLVIESFDTLGSRPVIWLWKFRLAMGKLAIFDGDPGRVPHKEPGSPNLLKVPDDHKALWAQFKSEAG
jgi:hypothetical protein